MKDNRDDLMETLKEDIHREYVADYITRNEKYEIIAHFEEWLKTANIGDTYFWNEHSYPLEYVEDID